MPAVSVIMAFHRVTPFLRPAVRSVLDQTCRDLELVLVDNGTGGGLAALGEDGRDPRIRLLSRPTNEGIAAAHNAAVAAAEADVIGLLDYDDLARPERFERQLAALRNQPATGLVSCGAEAIDEHGRTLGREFSLAAPEDQFRYTAYAAPVVTPAYAGRRALLAQVPYRTEFRFSADFDFLARAAERQPFGYVADILLQYRHHPGQTTVEKAARIARERCVVRLLTARRRAGRPEGGDWRALLEAPAPDDDRVAVLEEFSRRFLAEGFPVQAAYHARQCFGLTRTAPAFFRAARLFARIWRQGGAERVPAGRMFLRGPVRALGVRRNALA